MAEIDLGEKLSETTVAPSRGAYYPTIYIENKNLPFEDGDVGKTFDAKVKIKLTGITTRNKEGDDRQTYDFEVRKIEFQKDEKLEDYTRMRVKTKRIKGG